MKHQHAADLNVRLDIPTQDLENLIDKTTESVLLIIGVATAAHILKQLIK